MFHTCLGGRTNAFGPAEDYASGQSSGTSRTGSTAPPGTERRASSSVAGISRLAGAPQPHGRSRMANHPPACALLTCITPQRRLQRAQRAKVGFGPIVSSHSASGQLFGAGNRAPSSLLNITPAASMACRSAATLASDASPSPRSKRTIVFSGTPASSLSSAWVHSRAARPIRD